MIDLGESFYKLACGIFLPGLGRDKFNETYKTVWLYNSSDIGSENVTACEVFDFSTNVWRYVTPSAPCRISNNCCHAPVYVDGSLHWFTECKEIKVLSFDLHTETFQVLCKAPFANVMCPYFIIMCNLDNRLCVSERKGPDQVVWLFDSGNKAWLKMFSIDLEVTFRWLGMSPFALVPVALFDGEEKKKLLFYRRDDPSRSMMAYDPETESYHAAFDSEPICFHVCDIKSLISIS